MRISLQVAAGYFLIVGLAGWFVLDVFVEEVEPGVRDTMEDTLVDSANLIAELVAPALLDPHPQAPLVGRLVAEALEHYRWRTVEAAIWQHRKRTLDLRVYVTDGEGRVVFSTEPHQLGKDYSRWNDIYLTLAGRYGARSTRTTPSLDTSSVMHVAAPVLDRDGGIIGVVSLAKPAYSVAPIVAISEAKIRDRGLVLLAITAVIGALFTWHLTRAIERLRGYARAVTAGERRDPPRSRARELAELADALGEMRERLEGKQYVERYLHTLTHELKSPLAAIRGAAELLTEPDMPDPERRRFLDNIREQSDRLTQIADRLLELARVEQQQTLARPEPVELAALLEECVEGFAPLAAQRDIGMDLRIGRSLQVQGDRFLLARALSNLLDNALGFSPDGGRIRIELLESQPSGRRERLTWAEIAIGDQGPGIPDYARDRVFERFFSLPRPRAGRRGTGLGLSFVREVAELHGGSIALEDRSPTGTRARLRLPAVVSRMP
ncbi:two-component system sensor histidine kinase CreC [Imhoffiella purpurea]|uniref:histidine kinase n=1 Tax=Imhoffiella purpurea TaxID=1249627 RepID=W9VGE6_9GAMM|nr:two-component system sensor histidine kinase CreC [Imhoffiella purpurea]EXJ16076.1 Two-component response regulator CreC [Imhoffiella purpurea]